MVSGFSDRFNSPFAPFLQDECSFVSLRDVERAVQVTSWFHQKMGLFLPLIKEFDQEHGIPMNIESKYQVFFCLISHQWSFLPKIYYKYLQALDDLLIHWYQIKDVKPVKVKIVFLQIRTIFEIILTFLNSIVVGCIVWNYDDFIGKYWKAKKIFDFGTCGLLHCTFGR